MGVRSAALAALAFAVAACSSTNATQISGSQPSTFERATTSAPTTTTTIGATSTTSPTTALVVTTPADYAAALQPVIGSLPSQACLVVGRSGTPLVDHNGELALVPASTQKLLVGLAALEELDAGQVGMVGEMLRNSDKDAAERLISALGGLPSVRAWLAGTGLDTAGVVINDGTGFDLGNRLSCSFLVALLDRAGPASTLAGALPVAGETGTLTDRLEGTPAVGKVRAKTGTLRGISALAGFATGRDGSALTFAIVVNAPRADTDADRLWSAVATALVTA
jgi:serine-type D-Ala-D-Ala carboxypeptidase/endopeptidase (penicillin-binding protein 4)